MFSGDLQRESEGRRVEVLVDAMRANPDAEALQEVCLRELAAVGGTRSALEALVRVHGVDLVAACVHTYRTNAAIVRTGTALLRSLCTTGEDALVAAVARAGGVEMALTALVGSEKPDVLTSVVSLFNSLLQPDSTTSTTSATTVVPPDALRDVLVLLSLLFASSAGPAAQSDFLSRNGVALVLGRAVQLDRVPGASRETAALVDSAVQLCADVLARSSVPSAVSAARYAALVDGVFALVARRLPDPAAATVVRTLAAAPGDRVPRAVYIDCTPLCIVLHTALQNPRLFAAAPTAATATAVVVFALRGMELYVREHAAECAARTLPGTLLPDLCAVLDASETEGEGNGAAGTRAVALAAALATIASRAASLAESGVAVRMVRRLRTYLATAPPPPPEPEPEPEPEPAQPAQPAAGAGAGAGAGAEDEAADTVPASVADALAVVRMASFTEAGKRVLAGAGGVALLLDVAAALGVRAAATAPACSALWNLATNSAANQNAILAHGVAPLLACVRASPRAATVQACCAVLGNTASAGAANRRALGDLGAVAAVAGAMRRLAADSDVQRAGLTALYNLVLDCPATAAQCTAARPVLDHVISIVRPTGSTSSSSSSSSTSSSSTEKLHALAWRLLAALAAVPGTLRTLHEAGVTAAAAAALPTCRNALALAHLLALVAALAVHTPARDALLARSTLHFVYRMWHPHTTPSAASDAANALRAPAAAALTALCAVGSAPLPAGPVTALVASEAARAAAAVAAGGGSAEAATATAFCRQCLAREADARLAALLPVRCTTAVLAPCADSAGAGGAGGAGRHRGCARCCLAQPCYWCLTCASRDDRARLCTACFTANHRGHDAVLMFEPVCCACTDPACPCHGPVP